MNNSYIEEIKKIPPKFFLNFINKLKQKLKINKVIIDMFKTYQVDLDDIDYIPMYFKDLDVSATTDHASIFLNYKLLIENSVEEIIGYLIHEINHYLSQAYGDKPTKGSDDGNYLDNKFEQEAFQYQISYLANELGEDKAEKYTNQILNYHDIDNKEKKEKKETLMAKV